MVAKKPQNKNQQGKGKKPVQKSIGKKDNDKSGLVDANFKVNETKKYKGTCVYYNKASGFGFITLKDSNVVPGDKVMCYWKEISSDDRWPFLHKGLEVETKLQKVKQRGQFAIKAKEITKPGGGQVNLQDESDAKREYVGDQNMRFLGNVKFFDFEKGFGYVKIQDGYDIDSAVPSEFRIHRAEINSGEDAPRLRNEMEIEFGISKNAKGQYSAYNITLPGGGDILRDVVDERKGVSTQKYQGEVLFWNWKQGYGWIQPASSAKFPNNIKEAIKKDSEARKAKAEKNGKKAEHDGGLYVASRDKADRTAQFRKGDKVQFKVYTDRQGVGACEVAAA